MTGVRVLRIQLRIGWDQQRVDVRMVLIEMLDDRQDLKAAPIRLTKYEFDSRISPSDIGVVISFILKAGAIFAGTLIRTWFDIDRMRIDLGLKHVCSDRDNLLCRSGPSSQQLLCRYDAPLDFLWDFLRPKVSRQERGL